MLVLSRHESDSIRFPDLDITIEVLRLKGKSVRLGIEAPVEIKVLRGELYDAPEPKLTKKIVLNGEDQHGLRNKLNSLSIAISLAEKQIERNQPELAANLIEKAISHIERKIPAPHSSLVEEEADFVESQTRALLVEDIDNERTMLAGFLRLHGFAVDSVSDGLEALSYLESHAKPDFILMDMGLPNLDGPSAIRSIRDNPAFDSVKIFAVSGKTAHDVGMDTTENRIENWFQKPIEPKSLLSAICECNRAVALN